MSVLISAEAELMGWGNINLLTADKRTAQVYLFPNHPTGQTHRGVRLWYAA
jgi:hypothetical protein